MRPQPFTLLAAAAAVVVACVVACPPAAAEAQGTYGPLPPLPKDAELLEKASEMEELFVRRGVVIAEGTEAELVRRIGAAVAPREPADPYQRYRFGLVDDPVPNAFALPDGQIYVHAGLLALLENEAQLASVLAHEVMHVEGHHSILNARQARRKQGGMVVLSAVLGQVGSLINIAFVHAIIGYGRALEEEADRRAVERVLEAGYDAREMPRIFELLEQDPEGERITPTRATWMDHPLNAQRMAYTREILVEMEPRILAEEAERGGLVVGDATYLSDVSHSARETVLRLVEIDRPRTALALAERVLEEWPEDAHAHYLVARATHALDARTPTPLPEELDKPSKREAQRERARWTRYERERRRLAQDGAIDQLARNRELARQEYEAALGLDPQHARALVGLGQLLEDLGDPAGAGRRYHEYLQVAPRGAPERPIVLSRLARVTDELERRAASAAPARETP